MALQIISGTTRTNLGPLSSDTFSYTCTRVYKACSTCDEGWAAQTCIKGTLTDNTDCWPPRATGVPAGRGPLLGWGVYSPGTICPAGFTSVATMVSGGSSDYSFQFPLTSGESAIGCCPEGGFVPIKGYGRIQTCVQFQATTPFLLGSCGSDGPAFTPFTIGGEFNSVVYPSFSVSAPFLQVVHQASDLPATSTSSLTNPATSTTSTSNSPVSPANTQSSETSKSSSLSPGAAAGIAIGALVALILIAAGAFFFLRRYRKNRLAAPQQWDAGATGPAFKPYEPVHSVQVTGPNEMLMAPHSQYDGATPSNSLGSHPSQVAELASPGMTSELGSDYSYR
ncbi:hypothetical protein F4861DRAFT_535555 [Xylaria intraflava]|nr:hypothetical protein F4861DRAFT_535555 [Xylaria intraflava]